jgi:phosphatidylserine decarboxylase
MKQAFAHEASPVMVKVLFTGAVLSLASLFFLKGLTLAVALITLAAMGFTAFFFRDPARIPPEGEKNVLAPADGKIIDISSRFENEYLNGDCLRISIFMSLWNVHVNRVPVNGIVEHVAYRKGRFLAAFRNEAPEMNEMRSIGINTGTHKVLVRQIAGTIARRIRTYKEKGDSVRAGEKLGLIAFGSRVDIYLPPGFAGKVSLGQTTRAGESILGVLP